MQNTVNSEKVHKMTTSSLSGHGWCYIGGLNASGKKLKNVYIKLQKVPGLIFQHRVGPGPSATQELTKTAFNLNHVHAEGMT